MGKCVCALEFKSNSRVFGSCLYKKGYSDSDGGNFVCLKGGNVCRNDRIS